MELLNGKPAIKASQIFELDPDKKYVCIIKGIEDPEVAQNMMMDFQEWLHNPNQQLLFFFLREGQEIYIAPSDTVQVQSENISLQELVARGLLDVNFEEK